MIAKFKKYLSSNQYDIEYIDMLDGLGNNAYNTIIEHAQYNFQLTRDSFSKYLEIHKAAISPLLETTILAVRWGKWSHIKPFGDLLVKLCIKPFRNGESFIEYTQYLHALAPMLLFNVMGIACVKYNRFRELDNILRLSVPAPNFIDIARRRPLLYLLGGTHWSYDRWNSLMRERYYYPFSIFFLKSYDLF